YPTSLVVNDQQELFLLGRTNSTNFPVAANAYQPSLNVGPAREAFDLVVMHFSEDGTQLLGSTYLGGAGEDGVNGTVEINEYTATKHNYGDESRGEIIMAPNGDCVFTASSQSNNFPVSSGAAQPAYGGMQDMVVVRMTQDMSTIVSSTYMGGNGEDAGYGIKMKSDGSYVIAGGTGSNNFPATAGGWQSSFNGGSTDGVVSWISPDMRSIWQSTYLGTSAYDQAYFVELDENENVYLAGQSEGSMPIQPAVSSGKTSIYSNPDSRQFILKLSSDLSDMLYATTVGAVGSRVADIVPTAFLVDQCENVYLSGWGGEVNNGQNGPGGYTFNMPLTSDALQSNTDGSDFYLLVLSRDAELLTYGSYFGGRNSDSRGEHVDGGTSRFDASGQIYQAVCAGCGGESTFPSTPTAFSRTNNSSNCNMAVFKMQFDLSGVIANYLPLDENQDPLPDNAGCAPLTVNFDNISTEKSSLSSWLWDFDDSGNTSTVKSPQYTFTQPGRYDVMLILSDPLSCNEADTIVKVIEVYDIPDAAAGNDTTICVGDAITLNGSGTGTPIWTPAGSLSATDVFMPTATPTVETAYVLNITDVNGCTNEDTVSVSIDDLLQVDAGNDTLVCENTSLTLRANATGASLYAWSPALQLIDAAVLQPQVSPLSSSTMFTVVASSAIGCTVTDSIFVEVFSINLNSDTSVCRGDSVQLSSIGNASSWQWSPATGLSNPTIASPVASPDQTTTYQLLAQDASGCQSTQDVEVSVRDLPLVAAGIDQQICGTGTVNLQASGALTYVWTPASSLSAPASALTAASPTVTTTYTVEGRDAFGCEATDDVTVSVAPLPDVQAGPDEILCLGDTTRLSVSGGISFSWTPATSLSSSSIENPLAFPSVTTDFIVTGRNTFGCVGMDTLTVEVVSPPQVSIQGPASICTGQRVTLQASGADSYLWNTGETASAIDVSPFNMTTYWVRGERQGCAGDSAAKTISVFNDFPLADFAATPTSGFIPLAVQFVDNSLGADRVQWLFGDGNSSQDMSPLHTYTRKGDYEAILVAYSPNNCPDTASMLIEVLGPAVFVPTAFTPNGDGNNDEFQLTILGFEEFSISIYSRWGVKVFSSMDRNFSWDGIYKGEALPEGAYVYVIEGEHSGGQPYSKGGTLTIIR
ncbi:MAG: PKD domain-containing protein, partial [Bacteroidota bacterium]